MNISRKMHINTKIISKYVLQEGEQFERLSKLSKKYRTGKLPAVDWLDRLTFSEIERINQKEGFLLLNIHNIMYNIVMN